nr:MAG TPA: hypothetical protein [Caudoviricetes sp.]
MIISSVARIIETARQDSSITDYRVTLFSILSPKRRTITWQKNF